MIKIRKGKDIVFRWSILTNGNSLPLQGEDGQTAVDISNAFALVRTTEEEDLS